MRWFDASVRAMRRFTCPYVPPNPVTIPCYDIGSIGPGGGMVFALPYTGWNNTKYYLSENDIPMIYDCVANFSCKIVKIIKIIDNYANITKNTGLSGSTWN